jgi:hypothetical protein
MTPELEFASMTAFDRIEISKGSIDGVIIPWRDGRFDIHWSDACDDDARGDKIVTGTALDAMTTLIRMMDKALADAL